MDVSVEAELQGLADGLDKGLFFDNLEPLIETAKRIVDRAEGTIQLAAWIVESVLADLQTFWDDYPVAPAAHARVNEALGPALKRVVRSMIAPDQRVFLAGHQEALVSQLIELQHDQAIR
jgi:hypothetical protein